MDISTDSRKDTPKKESGDVRGHVDPSIVYNLLWDEFVDLSPSMLGCSVPVTTTQARTRGPAPHRACFLLRMVIIKDQKKRA